GDPGPTGPQGDPGIQGPSGPPGPTGPVLRAAFGTLTFQLPTGNQLSVLSGTNINFNFNSEIVNVLNFSNGFQIIDTGVYVINYYIAIDPTSPPPIVFAIGINGQTQLQRSMGKNTSGLMVSGNLIVSLNAGDLVQLFNVGPNTVIIPQVNGIPNPGIPGNFNRQTVRFSIYRKF
ncbi:hypothetical protein COF61_22185, partial [Bacillus toyonensis]